MKPIRTLLAAAIAAFAFNAHAVELSTDGTWTTFDFGGEMAESYQLSNKIFSLENYIPALDTFETEFTFTLTQNGVLRVVDGLFSGDEFLISIAGLTLGTTSQPIAQSLSEDPIGNPVDAWNDTRFSRGQWSLGAGSYTVTGIATSPVGGGIGFMSVTAVPEPESYAMLLAGLGLLGAIARRRGYTV